MRKFIVVLGMHRSGTSAFSGVLNILGANLGVNLMSSAEDNPKGFFENDNIVQLNEKILRSLNSSWDDLFFLPENWWDDEKVKTFKKEAIKIIETEFNHGVSCIKDPRMSKLFPFWRNVFKELNIIPHFIIAVRNPLEVAHSLKKRDGFSVEKSTLLWFSYMLDAEYFSRNYPRIFIAFDDLLTDAKGVIISISSIFDIDFPNSYADVETKIKEFLEPNLRHYTFKDNEGNRELLEVILDFYHILLHLTKKEGITKDELSKVDNVRAEFVKVHRNYYNADLINYNNAFIANLKTSYETALADLKASCELNELKIKDLETTLAQIYNTRSWRLIQRYYFLRDKILPYGTKRRHLFDSILKLPFLLNLIFEKDIHTIENIKKSVHYVRLYGISGFLNKATKQLENKKSHKRDHINKYFFEVLMRQTSHEKIFERKQPVDILVPVCNSYEITAKCINNVISNSENCRLILINGGITDGRIDDFLITLKDNPDKKITIIKLKNKQEIALLRDSLKHASNHFVILSSAAEVPRGWLDKLFAPIFMNEDIIGSVTPFSSSISGDIFPTLFENNGVFKSPKVETINSYFEKYGSDKPIEIPTALGSCVAFNKKAIKRTGLFDEETFMVGCYPDSEWCIRTHKAGFKNVLTPNLFIPYDYNGSTQPDNEEKLIIKNLKRLEKKYPEYTEMMEDFISKDPLKDIRKTLEVIVDSQTKNGRKLYSFVEHVGGGSEQYVSSLTDQLKSRGDIITARFKYDFNEKKLIMIYSGSLTTEEFALKLDAIGEQLKDAFKLLKTDYIFVNQLVSWPNIINVVDNVRSSNIPYIILVHDFFYICPSWNLLNDKGIFCNLPELDVCNKCLPNNKFSSHTFYYKGLFDLSQWRRVMLDFLQNAKYIVCPSESVKNYFGRAYKDLNNLIVIEHFETDLTHKNEKRFSTENELVVAILGDLGYHKGEEIFKKVVERIKSEELPIKIVVIGYSRSFPAPYRSKDGRLFIHGRYNRMDLPELLEKYNVSVILMPSICPETFSYTISEAMILRYPLICFNLGAQAERVRKYNCGIVVEDISVEGLIGAFKELLYNPDLIQELSSNASGFRPQSGQEYVEKLMKLLN